MVSETRNTIKAKPAIVRRAKVPGLVETARRLGRNKSHVFQVLTGARKSPHAAQYRRVNAKVLRDAGFTPLP